MRTLGEPSAVAVARAIALCSGSCAAFTSSNQRENCAIGSGFAISSVRTASVMRSDVAWDMMPLDVTGIGGQKGAFGR